MTKELMEKARQAKNAEELMAMSKEKGLELSAEQAKALFETVNSSAELSDDELANAAGGACEAKPCPYCGSENTLAPEHTVRDFWFCYQCGKTF